MRISYDVETQSALMKLEAGTYSLGKGHRRGGQL